MRTVFICVLSMLLLIGNAASAQNFQSCGIKNTSTSHGEILKFKVYYTLAGLYVAAGEATFSAVIENYQQRKVFHVTGEGHTLKTYDWFYKVRDVYESYIDTATMLPLKFIRNVAETGNRIYDHVVFDHKLNTAVSRKGSIQTPDCVQDVLSAIYYARNINFSRYKVNDVIPFNMYLDDQVYPLYIRYLGKEKLHTRYGDYNTIKFRPKLIEGTLFKGGEDMLVYVTDDARKIPVYIETPILVGKIRVYFIP